MFREDLLRDQVIIVTGGGTGLGRSMAQRFGELGAKVAVCGRRQAVVEATAEELTEATGSTVIGLPCDVREYEAVESFVADVEARLGPITGLVNNAAGNFLAQTERLSPNGFKTVVDIVLQGTFHATLAVGRRMIELGTGGAMLSIVTTYAWTGSSFVVPSAAAKAGVLAITRSLAVEWARYRIRSNAIAPGPFPTEGAFSRLMPPAVEAMAKQKIPLRRFGRHEELTNLAAYLMSEESGYVNGEVVTIDGGEWLNGGEFNSFASLPEEQLDGMFEQLRKATGH